MIQRIQRWRAERRERRSRKVGEPRRFGQGRQR